MAVRLSFQTSSLSVFRSCLIQIITAGQKPEGNSHKLSITIEYEGLVAASHMLTLDIQVSSFWNSTYRIGIPSQVDQELYVAPTK